MVERSFVVEYDVSNEKLNNINATKLFIITFESTNEGTFVPSTSYLRRSKVRKYERRYIWNERNELRIRRYTILSYSNLRNYYYETCNYETYVSIMHIIVIIVKMNFIWFFLFCMSVCQAVFHFETVWGKVKFCGRRSTLSWDTTSRHRQAKLIGWLARWQSPQSLRSPSPGLLRPPCIPPHLKLTGKFTSRELAVRWVRLRGSSSARRRNLSFEPAPASH